MDTLTKIGTFTFSMGGVVPDFKDAFEDAAARIVKFEDDIAAQSGCSLPDNHTEWKVSDSEKDRTITIETAVATYIITNMMEYGEDTPDNYVKYDIYIGNID